jgi:hypothetical protein
LNVELVEKAFALAKAHPELHDQHDYAYPSPCGTVMCIAGWICVADGWKVDGFGDAHKRGHRIQAVSFLAEVLAGLSEDTADDLFVASADDDMPMLEERWARIKEEAAE